MKTTKGFTHTYEGRIPHHRHPSGFDMPVVVTFEGRQNLTTPVRDEKGFLIYALPGGGRYAPGVA